MNLPLGHAAPYRDTTLASFDALREHLSTFGWAVVAESDLVRWAGFTGERISKSPRVQQELRERAVRLLEPLGSELSNRFAGWWWRENDTVCFYAAGYAFKVSRYAAPRHVFPAGPGRFVEVDDHGLAIFWDAERLRPTHVLQLPFTWLGAATLTTRGRLVLADDFGDVVVVDPESMAVCDAFGGLPIFEDDEEGDEDRAGRRWRWR
jgi:hypothetical protein